MVTKYRWTANTPWAHITNQRATKTFRDMGIEQQVLDDATPHELIGDTVFGIKDSLILSFRQPPPGTSAPDGRVIEGTWSAAKFDIVLAPGNQPDDSD